MPEVGGKDSEVQGACNHVTHMIMQEQLRQKLIHEPMLEFHEQFSEDPVQPMIREDAVALTDLLAKSLPLGSIQVGFQTTFWCWLCYAVFIKVRRRAGCKHEDQRWRATCPPLLSKCLARDA